VRPDIVDAGNFFNAATWSYGIAAVALCAFATRLALGWRPSMRARLLLAAVLASAAWAVAGVAAALWPESYAWLALPSLDALRYALWFLFLGNLLSAGNSDGSRPAVTPFLPPWAFVILTVALVASVVLPLGHPLSSAVADVRDSQLSFGVRLGLAVFGLILVEQLLRRAEPHAQWSIKPLCIGLAALFALDLFFYADAMLYGRLDPDIWIARGLASALVLPLIAVATARNTGWSIEMHMSRSAVFHSTAILVSGVVLLVIASAGYFVRYFGGEWGRAFQITFSFVAALIAVLVVSSGRFRSRLRVFISKHFFSYRYDYREEWLRFTRTLSAETSLHGVQEQCVRALANLVESPGGGLWIRQETDGFRPVSRWNVPAVTHSEPADGSIATFLQRTGWVIDLTEYTAAPDQYPQLTVPEWLVTLPDAWLVVPLVSGSELVGFAVLTTPRARIEVNWEVRDLLKTASRQAASYLGQIRATEALLEARKFDAFNRMSAFVVHDLKNLVSQLSLMVRNSERHRDNPEFQRDVISTVEHVVGRMNRLMLQLRTGTAPVEKPGLIQLGPLVRRVCAAKGGASGQINVEGPNGITSLGHEDRLEHVIGHLVQNALDATANGGAVTVRLARQGAHALLEVRDEGVGMTAEFIRDRLFKPFETSKPAGMGIGVYESAQYVAGLGGHIHFESEQGIGTLVRVQLPAAETAVEEPLQPRIAA
jgi:putative PEP-CTERM system histidine kinase